MKYLVIGAGGQNFFSYLGVLKKLENDIKNVEEYSGASCGSLISFLLCLGKTIDEIVEFGFKVEQSKLGKFKLKNLYSNFGFINSEEIIDYLIELLGCNPTFNELDKNLYISVYNLNLQKTLYFSKYTHPDMPILKAVCMSMSIPILVTSIKYKDHYYLDGGIFEQAPVCPFLGKKPSDITIIQTEFNTDYYTEINTFKEFLISFFYKCQQKVVDTYDHELCHIINVKLMNNVSSIDFNMDDDTKWKLFFYGYNILL